MEKFNMPYKSKEAYKKHKQYKDVFSIYNDHYDQLKTS